MYTLHGDLSREYRQLNHTGYDDERYSRLLREYRPLNHTCYDDEKYSGLLNTSIKLPILYSLDQAEFAPITCSITYKINIEDIVLCPSQKSDFTGATPASSGRIVKNKKMLIPDVINIMESLLNKNLQDAINLLKHKNINYAYDIASIMSGDCDMGFYRIQTSKRHDKYTNSYIYLAVIDKKIVECKLYQVNKEQIYVVTTLQKYERDNLWLTDIHDIINIDINDDDGLHLGIGKDASDY